MKKIFLSLNIVLVLLGHILVFFIWSYFLNINTHISKVILSEILLLFLFLVILAPLLIYYRDNYFNRALYLSMALWSGLIFNIILVALIVVLANIIIIYLNISSIFSFYTQQQIIIFLPFIILIWEAYNAWRHKIKKINIYISNLPEYWEGKKIVQLSDIHLGPIYRNGTFIRIVKKVNTLQADLICITGDLFDGMESDFSWLHLLGHKIRASLGTYYVFGNHELRMGKEKVRSLLQKTSINILDNDIKVIHGLQIIGLTCLFNKSMDFTKTLLESGYNKDRASILLFHEPKYIDEAYHQGINLELSGHTHNGQIFPMNILVKIIYKGYSYGLYKKDNYNLFVSAGTGTWGPPLRLGHHSEIVLITLHKK